NSTLKYIIEQTIVVDQSGSHFWSIQAAIDAVPKDNLRWVCIEIRRGIYREQIRIPREKPYIFLKGESRLKTVIAWDGHDSIQSATFISEANDTRAKGLTFLNSYNYGPSRNQIYPAVAAKIDGDRVAFYNCRFLGLQDTLWDVRGRHYFHRCTIEGAVDFIFGSGQSIYEGCTISVNVDAIGPGYVGYITAQGRSYPYESNGFVFKNCNIDGKGKVYLGRPWGIYSRVIFYKTLMSDVVVPQGWDSWRSQGQEYKLMFSEIDCRGMGANTTGRVGWVNKHSSKNLQPFIDLSYIDKEGWL
ncbi:probable pectinesterase 29, partial [Andrographis paniculata]|uniref:probable pectinesterase 29 n=1 Tax=Andrographis paniculata TaxID=175694 RepID=UPI0021E8215F